VSAPTLPLPVVRRSDDEEAKGKSAWIALQKHDRKLLKQEENVLARKKAEAAEEDRTRLSAHQAMEAKMKSIALRRNDFDRKTMDQIGREYRREKMEEKQKAKQIRLEVKDLMQSQIVESKQRRKEAKARQLLEDEQARRECARLVAEEKAEKAAAAEKHRQEMLETSRHLAEQARLKRIAVKEKEANEQKILKEYKEMMARQDAARAAQLQAMADDQARRMALNADVQKAQQANDDAMIARIDRHWKEKYAADDAKFKRECLERQ